jgi:glycosyltransferase involved in cell wall biosynthesis
VKISLVIPCRNEKGHIREFLDSLLAQDLEPGWEVEILVADGMSNDGTRDVLLQYARTAPHVRLIDNPGRIVSTGLNAAIGAATGDIIVRLDAHTTYARDYVRECVRVLQQTGADNVGGPWVAEGRGRVGRAIAAAFRSPFCSGGGKAHDPHFEGEVDTVYLGCWARTVFDRAGLFDPNLVRNQDDEFNFRLLRMGGRVWQSPRIKSTYTPRASLRALFRQHLQYGFWKVAVIRKHRALASWRHVVPALFVSSIVISLLLIAVMAVLGLQTAAAAISTVLAGELLLYAVVCFAGMVSLARRLEPLALLLLPLVFATYHVAYGLGFLAGTFQPILESRAVPPGRFFTALTR